MCRRICFLELNSKGSSFSHHKPVHPIPCNYQLLFSHLMRVYCFTFWKCIFHLNDILWLSPNIQVLHGWCNCLLNAKSFSIIDTVIASPSHSLNCMAFLVNTNTEFCRIADYPGHELWELKMAKLLLQSSYKLLTSTMEYE